MLIQAIEAQEITINHFINGIIRQDQGNQWLSCKALIGHSTTTAASIVCNPVISTLAFANLGCLSAGWEQLRWETSGMVCADCKVRGISKMSSWQSFQQH